MSASSNTKVPLTVRAADAGTEIFLVDARLNRQNKAVGELRTAVAPGLYKLRFRAAQTQIDRLIEIPPQGVPPIEASPVPFITATPLDDTADVNPAHQQIVRETTQDPAQRTLGAGSKLCLFVRDPPDEESESVWSGLGVHDLGGHPIADISDVPRETSPGIAALSLDLDPGSYRVRVSPDDAPAHEIFVALARGWQTLVFTLSDKPPGPGAPRSPRLRDASICMARLGALFEPGDRALRLAELLRYALESGRSILTDAALAEVLGAKGANPMLDIFAGHLLIRERPIKQPAITQIMERALELVGELPDVTVLHLRPGSGSPPRGLRIETPPLLRSSWNLIAAASRRRMSLVPPGSLTAEVGEGLVTHPLWLMNGVVDSSLGSKAEQEVMSFAEASRLLNRLIAIRPDQLDTQLRHRIEQVMAKASPLERSLLNTTLLQGQAPKAEVKGRSAWSLSKALKEIQVPQYSIARSAQRLKEKLGF